MQVLCLLVKVLRKALAARNDLFDAFENFDFARRIKLLFLLGGGGCALAALDRLEAVVALGGVFVDGGGRLVLHALPLDVFLERVPLGRRLEALLLQVLFVKPPFLRQFRLHRGKS